MGVAFSLSSHTWFIRQYKIALELNEMQKTALKKDIEKENKSGMIRIKMEIKLKPSIAKLSEPN